MTTVTIFAPDGTRKVQDVAADFVPPAGSFAFPCSADQAAAGGLTLDDVRPIVAAQIDAAANTRIEAVVTPGTARSMIYLQKVLEASNYLVSAATETPFLSAEAAATGTTVAKLAVEVTERAQAWKQAGAKIEAARVKAKLAARTAAGITALMAAGTVDWPSI